MAQTRVRETKPSESIRSITAALRSRRDQYVRHATCASEWRRLQFEAVQGLVEAQRTFLDLHTQIMNLLGRDRPLYAKLRLESLDVTQASDELRDLIREIERVLVEH